MLSNSFVRKIFYLFLFISILNQSRATINFSNENSRILLKDSNARLQFNQSTVNGWQDRSVTKKLTGRGLGDYNIVSYGGGDKIITYAEAPTELVYDNSNAAVRTATLSTDLTISNSNSIVSLDRRVRWNSNAIINLSNTSGTLPINNSNAIILLNRTARWNSNALLYGNRTNSNAIVKLSNNIKIYDTQQIYSSHATVDGLTWFKAGFEVYPGKILALKTPIAMTGQISLGGTLTLSSDLFMDAGTTFSSIYGFGQINGNNNAIHLNGDLSLTASHIMRFGSNLIIEGNGNLLTLGDRAQLFVDDNVTLTLRNITIKSTKNGVGNPAIKLASNRSQLVLENAKLDLANDFYFDRGHLYAYNDVNISGTNSFIYRSPMPSYIKSGGNIKFNNGTSFDFRPSTTSMSGVFAKDFLVMDDADSKLTFDGSTLKTTLTGMRLTKGQILLDNRVSLTSQSMLKLASYTTTLTTWNFGSQAYSTNWSPDGRFLAVAGTNGSADVKVFLFTGTGLIELSGCTKDFGTYAYSVNWSPDGKYLAVGGKNGTTNLKVYSFSGTALTEITGCTKDFGTQVYSVNWSPDGKYLAVGGDNGTTDLKVYSFSGTSLDELANCTKDANGYIFSVNWSPDGKYLSYGALATPALKVFSFSGTALTEITSKTFGTYAQSVGWSPDGRFLAVCGLSTADLILYTFNGTTLTTIAQADFATVARALCWSPDGRYFAVIGNNGTTDLIVYSFDGANITPVITADLGGAYAITWSSDGKYLVAGVSNATYEIYVYRLNYGPETLTQAVSNSIVLGNSSAGSLSDMTLRLLSGANVSVDGILNYDNVNSSSIFSNDNARFTLKDSNSKIRIKPTSVVGWRDRSLIKNLTGAGLGDYNLKSYDTSADGVVSYAEAPEELVYDNSNAIVYLDRRVRTDSNALLYLNRTTSNALLYGTRTNSNAIIKLGRDSANNSNAIVKLGRDSANNSNSIVSLDRRVRWNSNALIYGDRTNSNAIIKLNNDSRNNSNAIIKLGSDSKNNSNAIVKLGRDNANNSNAIVSLDRRVRWNSNAIIKLSVEGSVLPVQNSNAIKYLSDHFISVNNGKITALGGISGTTNVAGRGLLSSPIDLQGGTLTLNSDMILSNQTTVVSSGNFDLQGNAMIFGGDLTLPSNIVIKIISSGVLDGQGSEFRNAIGAKLIVDNNVSLTLCNMSWAAVGSPQIEMRDASSKLTLQNLSTSFDRDYSFTQGQLFIQDDVFVTGTNKFSYVSTATAYIASHSTLYFDKNTTFSYSPRSTTRHTRSERNLIKLLDKTSEIYFNECTLQLPDSGWQLTNGTIYFDNKVTTYGNTTQADSFEWGDGTALGDLDVKVLAGALLDDHGYIYHNSAN